MNCNLTMGFSAISVSGGYHMENGRINFACRGLNWYFAWLYMNPGMNFLHVNPADTSESSQIAMLKKGSIELLMLAVPHSLEIDGIELSNIFADDAVVMLSLSKPSKREAKDLTRLINWELWINCGLVVLIVMGISRMLNCSLASWNLGRSLRNAIWSSTEIIFSQHQTVLPTKVSKIMGVSISCFVFLMLAILSGLINTDLVIVEKPFMIDKLEDFLDPRASQYQPIWRKKAHLYRIFSESQSPIFRKIWQKAESFGLQKCLIDDNPIEFGEQASQFSKQPFVTFGLSMGAKFAKKLCCNGFQFESERMPHIGNQIITRSMLTVPYKFHNDTCKDIKRSFLNKRLQIMFEAHALSPQVLDSVDSYVLPKQLEQWKCLGYQDPFTPNDWTRISTMNIKNTLLCLMMGLLLSSIALIGEIIYYRYAQKLTRSKNPLSNSCY